MKDYQAAKRYAEALFGLIQDRKQAEQIETELKSVTMLLRKEPAFGLFMANASIPLREKEALADKALAAQVSALTANFVKVLIKKKRFGEIEAIQTAYHKLYEKSLGILGVEVVSAEKLSDGNKKKLEEVLKKKLRSEVRLVNEIRPDIIGGLVIRFGGKQIDGSYRGWLDSLRQSLLLAS